MVIDTDKVIQEINKDRDRLEASFVFCLWKNPSLYDDYKDIEDGTLITSDAKFYYYLGKALRNQGLNTFDDLSVSNYLSTKPDIRKRYEDYGGWKEVEQLKNLTSDENVISYFDQINKYNYLSNILKKDAELFDNIGRLKNLGSEEVYEIFDNVNTSASLINNSNVEICNVGFTDEMKERFKKGEAIGVDYSKAYPMLNYTTLGLPKGDMTLVTGHSGAGKSSFVFNLLLGIVKNNQPVAILSNEMQLEAYVTLLIAFVLTNDLDYYKITRKKIKQGNWTEEVAKKIDEAQAIINEKYRDKIFFVKLFGNSSNVVLREMKRLNRQHGVEVFCWDTYKSDDTMSDKMWQELLMSSRKVFNLVAKEKWSLICTFQLALYTTNQRYLDAGCLSTAKQIKEVVSEHIMLRKLWHDEYTGEKYDCKPYKFGEGNKKEYFTLDKDKLYVVAFIDKTRNDDNAKCILYKWDSVWNKWTEIGYCNIVNDHKGI